MLTLIGMYCLAKYWPLYAFDFIGRQYAVLCFCFLGAVFGLAAIMSFSRAQTTIDPRYPNKTSTLVTTGIYRFSRNPMYLGLLCFLCAAFIYFAAMSALLMLILFVLYMNHFQIAAEEAVLQAMFGERYEHYCRHVRRWC
ncbi:methyltransferase family protein [Photobacterium nomapromontoriensis]|uniref:methyltransferase family protein n=1 Tax=Photobacterium nomapromontoriensis TaxID=2910237 RepID=UPI003D114DA9